MTDKTSCCKLGRLKEKYQLDGLDNSLQKLRDNENATLHELANHVNQEVLRSALDETSINDDIGYIFETLTADEIPTERRVRVQDQLELAEISISSIKDDWVSHETVRRHLNTCLGIDTSRGGVSTIEDARGVIESVLEREETIIERTLARLGRIGVISTSSVIVDTNPRIYCEQCDTSYNLTDFLNNGGCACNGN